MGSARAHTVIPKGLVEQIDALALRRGMTLALADGIVTATAFECSLTVLTDDRRDFPIPELQFFDLP